MYGDKLPIAQSRWLVNRTEALARLANLLAIRVRGVTLPKRHWIDYESRERSAKKETFYKSWQEKMTITTQNIQELRSPTYKGNCICIMGRRKEERNKSNV